MSRNIHVVCPHCRTVNRLPAAGLANQPSCGKCKSNLIPNGPLNLTEADFDKHISRTDLPVVVDFWAPWCGPCKMMAPAFEQAAAKLAPGVRLAKVDTQAEQALGSRHGIQSIPTMVVFKGGREVARTSGAMNAARIEAWVKNHI